MAPRPFRPSIPALAAAMLVAGCASSDDRYPSLAPRPIEEVSLAEPASRPIPPATAPGIADARYAGTVEDARAGDAAFRRALAEARPALAAGREAAVGSDAWGEAQQALSRLQTMRAPVVEAAARLQQAREVPDAQADRGIADAALRALNTVRALDAAEARALNEAAPRRQ